jgi:ubiquinone/menaquinone biosynthesis C-methylase UbiE
MSESTLTTRSEREKDIYNKGIDRASYNASFGHAQSGYVQDRLKSDINKIMSYCSGKDVLELGSQSWKGWIDFNNMPGNLTCINISETELRKGASLYEESDVKIPNHQFLVMDANHLDFPDGSFDFVFGSGILHHLDFETALKEIHRVLRKDGKILFFEPLGRNPVGKLVRKLTPEARTPDEKPLDKEEIKILKKYFDLKNSYYQLFYVPAGWLSKYLFRSPYNPLMYIADKIDCAIESLSILGMYYYMVFQNSDDMFTTNYTPKQMTLSF